MRKVYLGISHSNTVHKATTALYKLLKPAADKAVEEAMKIADKAGEEYAVVINPSVVCAQFALMIANNFMYHGLSDFALGLMHSEKEMNKGEVTEEMFTEALFLLLDQHITALQQISEEGLEGCRELTKRAIHARTCGNCRAKLEHEHDDREYALRD